MGLIFWMRGSEDLHSMLRYAADAPVSTLLDVVLADKGIPLTPSLPPHFLYASPLAHDVGKLLQSRHFVKNMSLLLWGRTGSSRRSSRCRNKFQGRILFQMSCDVRI